MIEWMDVGLLSALLGKVGADEWFRRRDMPAGNGRNGNASLGRRVVALEKKVDGFSDKLDTLAGEIRDDIGTAKDWASHQHGELHEKINDVAKDTARLEGRVDGLAGGGR